MTTPRKPRTRTQYSTSIDVLLLARLDVLHTRTRIPRAVLLDEALREYLDRHEATTGLLQEKGEEKDG